MSVAGKSSDTAPRSSDIGTTYFSYTGPSAFDGYSSNPSHINGMQNERHNRRDAESLHSSPSEPIENEVMTMPIRPRPLTVRDPQSLVLIAPPYPGYPGYMPLAPHMMPFDPIMRTPSDESYYMPPRRSQNPYPNLQHMRMKHCVIFMASMFILAFIAVIFTAVYFGHKIDSRPRN